MLGVGDKFPEFKVKATVSTDKNNAFKDLTNESLSRQVENLFLLAERFHVCMPDRDRRLRQAKWSVSRPRRAGTWW